MKPLFYFKYPEFKFIGYRFSFPGILLLRFYNGTCCYERDEILIYASGENNLITNLQAYHDRYRVFNNQLLATSNTALMSGVLNAREKAEVYSRNFMTLYSFYYFIFKKRVRNRVLTSLQKIF